MSVRGGARIVCSFECVSECLLGRSVVQGRGGEANERDCLMRHEDFSHSSSLIVAARV